MLQAPAHNQLQPPPVGCNFGFPMASGFNFYSQIAISLIRISDIAIFEIVISLFKCRYH